MTKSLQDQLLGAGLVDKKKAKQLSKENRKVKNDKRRSKDSSLSESQAAAKKAQEEKIARDRQLNQERQQEADKKAISAQVHQLVQHYKVARGSGEQRYNFTDNNVVKSLRVDTLTSEEIVRGRLCIVRDGDSYEVVPKPIADKILERSPSAVVVYNQKDMENASQFKDKDDEYYAQFEIPDDLVW